VKIARFEKDNKVRYGIVERDDIFSLDGDLYGEFKKGSKLCKLKEVRLLAPVDPPIIVGLGFNYPEKAKKLNMPVPTEEPMLHFKPPTSVIGPLDDIVYPKISQKIVVAAELAVIIKRPAKEVTEKEAGNYILGYTCANDVSSSDILTKDKRQTRGKSFDTFCPLGPFIVTGLDGNNLALKLRVNGVTKSVSSTSHMTFKIERLVNYISQFKTMQPGEVINTGSADISEAQIGDIVDVEIEGIGVLTNKVVASR
jgi:2-keto-4-pentenoate hydratase/2-oxohepta-3-ene-1,7-dioic acid hydratase in catechol pathway